MTGTTPLCKGESRGETQGGEEGQKEQGQERRRWLSPAPSHGGCVMRGPSEHLPEGRMKTQPHILEIIKSVSALSDSICVGVSGGKDSLVCLDLAKKHFKKVAGYFFYLVPGLEFKERYLRYLERRYEIEILRLPDPQLADAFADGQFRWPTDRSIGAPKLKLKDAMAYAGLATGCQWTCKGDRRDDSRIRWRYLTHIQGIDHKNRIAYPLAFWTASQVENHLKTLRLPPMRWARRCWGKSDRARSAVFAAWTSSSWRAFGSDTLPITRKSSTPSPSRRHC